VPVLLVGVWSHAVHAGQAEPIAQLVHQKRYEEARRAIDAALARNATDPAALAASVGVRIASGASGSLPQARATAHRCVNANPESSLCAEALGHVLTAQAREGGFIALASNARATRDSFERALRLDPTNDRARVSLMRFYLATPFFLSGSEIRARELASEVRSTDPDLTRLMRALCALDENKFDDAEQYVLAADLREHVLVHDSLHELLLKLASAHFDAGRYARSARLFGELSRQVPSSEAGYYGLALVARAQGRLADAAVELEKAALIAAKPYVYKTLGEVHEARQDRPRAIAAYQAALAGVPPLELHEQKRVTAHLAQLQRR
jgi:tetratricopeptide (TPR) repeat protein